MITNIVNDELDKLNDILSKKDFSIIFFHTEWCGPWVEYHKNIEDISVKYDNIVFLSVNTEKNKAITEHFKIKKIPTTLFFHRKNIINEVTGLIQKSELLDKIKTTG